MNQSILVTKAAKGQQRGGKYKKRIPKPGGGFRYVYDKPKGKRGTAESPRHRYVHGLNQKQSQLKNNISSIWHKYGRLASGPKTTTDPKKEPTSEKPYSEIKKLMQRAWNEWSAKELRTMADHVDKWVDRNIQEYHMPAELERYLKEAKQTMRNMADSKTRYEKHVKGYAGKRKGSKAKKPVLVTKRLKKK